jgi:S1-C subfamily serine protease
MRNYYLFLVLVVSFLGNNSYAQNDVYFNQYASIRYLNNPAELTFNRKNGLYYFRRDQWLNSPLKSANNSILTGQLNVSRTVDLGLSMSQYNSGNAYSNSAYQLHLAWKGRVNDESNTYFSFGTNLKFGSLRTDFSNVLLFDPNDPKIPLTITSQNYWDVGTGFNFKCNVFNLGVALNSLRGYSEVNRNDFLFARTVTYNLGINLSDGFPYTGLATLSQPNIYLRARSINNAVWQGEGFIDYNVHMGDESQRNYVIIGIGVRRDFSTTYYNSILAHINLSFGGRAKLLLGVGPEFSTAPLGNVSSGNMEYIVGIEKGTKTDRFYQSLYEGDALLRQNKYLEASESYKNAKDIFPNSDLVERREKKTDAISQAWNEFNQFKDFAEQSFRSGNYSLAYDQILIAEKSLNNYKNELKRLTSKTNVPSEESFLRSKKQQYEKAKIASNSYLEGVKLFEEKKYAYALREFENAKRDFEVANVSISGDLINKIEVCKSIIKRQEEEERIKKIQNFIVTAKEKFKNEDYTGCLYDLNQILNGLDPNNIEAKNLKKDAEQKYQEQELKRRQKECDEHYDLAEKLKGQGKLEDALNEINAAIDVLENCERCDLLKTKIENEIESKKKQDYDNLVAEGDKAWEEKFELARLYYEKASKIIDSDEIQATIRSCSGKTVAGSNLAEIRKLAEPAVVLITVTHYFKTIKPFLSQGSGFFINSNGRGLTNSHVVNPEMDFYLLAQELTSISDFSFEEWYNKVKSDYIRTEVKVKTKNGDVYDVRVIQSFSDYMDNKSHDWAVFEVVNRSSKFPYLRLCSKYPEEPNSVYAVGFPKNDDVKDYGVDNAYVTYGVINNEVKNDIIPISVPIDHGSSGGPLLNEEGQVIGITTWGLNEFLHFALNIFSLPTEFQPKK